MRRVPFPAGILRPLIVGTVVFGLAASFFASYAQAGVVVSGPAVEQKNWHALGDINFDSHWQAVVDWGWRVTTAIHLNNEGVHGTVGRYYYNYYPGTITVTDPVLPTTSVAIPFIMMVDTVSGPVDPPSGLLTPFPTGAIALNTAAMEGLQSGAWHTAHIDSFFDVFTELFIAPGPCNPSTGESCLPRTGPNGEVYTWDTSMLKTGVRGDWYVAMVEMSADELSQAPEPSVFLLVAPALLALRLFPRRR